MTEATVTPFRCVDPEAIVRTAELGKLLGVSRETIRKAARDEIITDLGNGRFRLAEAIQGYVGNLRSVASGHGGADDAADLARERALLARAQREGQELKNAVTRGSLVEADGVAAGWIDLLAFVRANMLTAATRIGQRLTHLSKHDLHVIDEVVRDILTKASDDADGPGDDPPEGVGDASPAPEDAAFDMD